MAKVARRQGETRGGFTGNDWNESYMPQRRENERESEVHQPADIEEGTLEVARMDPEMQERRFAVTSAGSDAGARTQTIGASTFVSVVG